MSFYPNKHITTGFVAETIFNCTPGVFNPSCFSCCLDPFFALLKVCFVLPPPFKHLWASSCSNFSGWFAQWLTTVLHVGFCLSNVSVFIVLTCRKIFTDTMPGEGGMVLCDDPNLAERSRVLWQDRSSNWIDGSQVMNICGPFVHLLQLAGANNFVTCALIRRSGVLCMRPRAAGLEDIASTWKHQHLSCGSFRSWDGTIAWPICRLGQKA